MKNITLLLSSIVGFFIILGCLFYNLLLIDMDRTRGDVTECNAILQDVIENEDKINDKKGEYISRLMHIKENIKESKTSFLFNKYKNIKAASIDSLIHFINEDNKDDKNKYLQLILKSDKKSQDEMNILMNKNFIEVTYLTIKTYINI